ncbi:hypothetical protein [Amycolatopsis vastitatis]|uniref:Uncharacterized protein n=1 Tax=Amycolatopsis vastitatis TaxID=1905142 RepID=A0A229SQN3_9PSEU|nr:hypothetical protein [Amycolatopsis vastitatis]OXM60959.1 hypothetical protein CF165_39875 [Amycolatopsis vastitatis]
MGLSEQKRLGRFVRRARRIEALSLVQDKQVLQQLLEDNIRAEIPEDGSDITLRMALPENEEVFESLAARVRPLLVKTESILLPPAHRRSARDRPGVRALGHDVGGLRRFAAGARPTSTRSSCSPLTR